MCIVKNLKANPGRAELFRPHSYGGIVPSERNLDVAAVHSLVIAGRTWRNLPALEAHIKELEALGVKRPKSVPISYRNAAALLTTGAAN